MNSAADNKLIEKAAEWAKQRPISNTIDIHQTMLRVAVDALQAIEDKQPLKLDQLDNLKDEIQHCIEEDRNSSTTKFARVFSLLMKKLQGSVLTSQRDKDSSTVPARDEDVAPQRAIPNGSSSTGAVNAVNIKQEAGEVVAPETPPAEPHQQPPAPQIHNATVPERQIKEELQPAIQPQIFDVSDDEFDVKPVVQRVMTIPPAIPRKPQSTTPADPISSDNNNNNNNNNDKTSTQPASLPQQPPNTATSAEVVTNKAQGPKGIPNMTTFINTKKEFLQHYRTLQKDPLMCNTLTQPAPAMVPEDQRLNVVQQLQQLQQVRLQPMPKQKEPAQVPKEAEKQLQQPQPTDVLQAPAQQPAKRKRVIDKGETPDKSTAQAPPEPRPKRASAQRACKMMEDLGAEDAQERQPRSSRRSTAAKRTNSVASEPIQTHKAIPPAVSLPQNKCAVSYCDFATNDAEKLYNHLKEVHKGRAVIRGFEKGTKCPYCPIPLDDLSHYVAHRAKDHADMEEPMIFACANCPKKTAQVHTMLLHWNWKNCEKTMKFDYNLAKLALAKKRNVEEKEAKKPSMK